MVEKAEVGPGAGDWLQQFYAPLRQFGHRVAEFFAPSADASGSRESYEIRVELPGVAEDDIHIELHDGRLTIAGEKRSQSEQSGKDYFFSERIYGKFQRSFSLPRDADPNGVTASHKDGLLTVKIAKQQPAEPAPRKIAIERG